MNLYKMALIVSLVLFVTSCTVPPGATQEPTVVAQAIPAGEEVSTASESPLHTPDSPLTAPQASVATLEIPQPAAGMATVSGRLMADTSGDGSYEAVPLSVVFLAPVIFLEDGTPGFAGLDNKNDPSAGTNPDGYFLFENVPPGSFGVVVARGVQFILIRDEEGQDYLIEVEADQVLDLGEVRTTLPKL